MTAEDATCAGEHHAPGANQHRLRLRIKKTQIRELASAAAADCSEQ